MATTTKKKADIAIEGLIADDGYSYSSSTLRKELAKIPSGTDLNIYINSPGGSVFEGISIYQQLARWSGKKKIYIDGIAASIASVIAMSADERVIAENGMMMIHDPYTMAFGTAKDMRKTAESLDKICDAIIRAYSSSTKMPPEKLRKMMAEETWMDAKECMDMGFCTKSEGIADLAASLKNESVSGLLCKYQNTPKSLLGGLTRSKAILASMNMVVLKLNGGKTPIRA